MISAIVPDPQGGVWLATQGDGLRRLRPDGSWRALTREQGLPCGLTGEPLLFHLLSELGDAGEALTEFGRGLALLEPLAQADPKDLGLRAYVADLQRQKGDAHVALARRGGVQALEHWRAAQAIFTTSQQEWEHLRAAGADPGELKKAEGLQQRLAACRAALGPG